MKKCLRQAAAVKFRIYKNTTSDKRDT